MSDIYTIISKSIAGESTQEEEQLVQQFKLENPEEFAALQAFWTKKEVNLSDFDTSKGWEKVNQKTNFTDQKKSPSYTKWIAAIIALLLLSFAFYFSASTPEIVEVFASEQNQKIELEDGSIVFLNSDAKITYPNKFANNKRVVSLQGEAFFEVSKDASRPFIINTNHSTVEVLGTSFNIDTEKEETEVIVKTGKVKVASITQEESVILTPNESAIVSDNNLQSFDTKNLNYLYWKTGELHFEKTSIDQVVTELNTHFENKIELSNSDSDCQLTTIFKNSDLKEILEIIQLSCNLTLTQKNETYVLK